MIMGAKRLEAYVGLRPYSYSLDLHTCTCYILLVRTGGRRPNVTVMDLRENHWSRSWEPVAHVIRKPLKVAAERAGQLTGPSALGTTASPPVSEAPELAFGPFSATHSVE